jgi:hypothetical protein
MGRVAQAAAKQRGQVKRSQIAERADRTARTLTDTFRSTLHWAVRDPDAYADMYLALDDEHVTSNELVNARANALFTNCEEGSLVLRRSRRAGRNSSPVVS